MSQWKICPSYKYDLAAFCNLFTLKPIYQELHPEAWQHFRTLIEASPENLAFARQLNDAGVLVSSALTAIFDSFSYNGSDIEELCQVLDSEELLNTKLRSYFLDTGILTPETWEAYKPIMPAASAIAKYVHHGGFSDWWQDKCLPEIKTRCSEFESEAGKYPVIETVNHLLGAEHALQFDTITVYLCKYSAPNGTSLINQSFVSDIRWRLETTVLIALHEMMHPPFGRKKITEIAEGLVDDKLVTAARSRLQTGNYSTPLFFLEENIVEGAHIYLAEKMGLEDNPLQYFISHDNSTHVISPLVYDSLCRWQAEGLSLEQVVDRMVVEGMLKPGAIHDQYQAIYASAGISHPYQL